MAFAVIKIRFFQRTYTPCWPTENCSAPTTQSPLCSPSLSLSLSLLLLRLQLLWRPLLPPIFAIFVLSRAVKNHHDRLGRIDNDDWTALLNAENAGRAKQVSRNVRSHETRLEGREETSKSGTYIVTSIGLHCAAQWSSGWLDLFFTVISLLITERFNVLNRIIIVGLSNMRNDRQQKYTRVVRAKPDYARRKVIIHLEAGR